MPNWHTITYLQTGSTRQQQAYAALVRLGILDALRAFTPVLAGTIPLGIDTPASDLDLICAVPLALQPSFEQLVRRHYGHLPAFSFAESSSRGLPAVVCGFWAEGFAWELFGQALPVARQYAVRHLEVEHAILQAGGEPWRAAVQQLKQQGMKTEPAFARLLQLPGDPYEALLTLESLTPAQLRARLAECPLR